MPLHFGSLFLSAAPSGAFFRVPESPIELTATRPVGRMYMLETTALFGLRASPAREMLLRAGFFCGACHQLLTVTANQLSPKGALKCTAFHRR